MNINCVFFHKNTLHDIFTIYKYICVLQICDKITIYVDFLCLMNQMINTIYTFTSLVLRNRMPDLLQSSFTVIFKFSTPFRK